MPKLHLFLDEHNFPAKLLVADVGSADDLEGRQFLLDAVTGFMDGDAKTLVVSDNFDVTVYDRG